VRWVNTCDHVSEGLVTIGAEAGFGRLPDTGRDLCSQPTASRREREVAELSREAAAIVGDYDEFVKRLSEQGLHVLGVGRAAASVPDWPLTRRVCGGRLP
jgi:hypothetical protein